MHPVGDFYFAFAFFTLARLPFAFVSLIKGNVYTKMTAHNRLGLICTDPIRMNTNFLRVYIRLSVNYCAAPDKLSPSPFAANGALTNMQLPVLDAADMNRSLPHSIEAETRAPLRFNDFSAAIKLCET